MELRILRDIQRRAVNCANEILHRLKFDNDTIRKVTKLVRYRDHRMPVTPAHVRRAEFHEIGEVSVPALSGKENAPVAEAIERQQSMLADDDKEEVADIWPRERSSLMGS